jgi:UDP-glucuronate 4-epimerase
MDYVEALERHLGKKARKNFMPMQPGDIRSTLADTSLLYNLTGYRPNTSISEGIKAFTDWYKSYYAADKANV